MDCSLPGSSVHGILQARLLEWVAIFFSTGCSLEGLMLKLKLQYFGHLMWRVDSLEKTLMLGKIEGRRRRGWQRMRLAGWHHWLNGHKFEWTPGAGDGQGGLVCCDSWGHKESDRTEQLNWTELNWWIGTILVRFSPSLISMISRVKPDIYICTYCRPLSLAPCLPSTETLQISFCLFISALSLPR